MHAVATQAPTDRRLHQTGLQAYWRAVDAALADEAAAIEAAERAALAAAHAALADVKAEHAALLARIAEVEAAGGGAATPAATSDVASAATATSTDEVCEDCASATDKTDSANTDTPDNPGSPIPTETDAAETRDAAANTAPATPTKQEQSMERAEAAAEPGVVRPAAATAHGAATRRRAALAALDERLAPVRAERTEAEAALGALVEANAQLRVRLAALDGAEATVAVPA